jgi:hypothetical protein
MPRTTTAKEHDAGTIDAKPQGRRVYTKNGRIRIKDQPQSRYYISPTKAESLGIRPDEDYFWARNRNHPYWKERDITDRVEDTLRDFPGSRLIVGVDGNDKFDRYTKHDHVLMAIPKHFNEERQKEIDADAEQFLAEYEGTDDPEKHETFIRERIEGAAERQESDREIYNRMRQWARQMKDARILGPTRDKSLDELYDSKGDYRPEVKRLMDEVRRGGNQAPVSHDDWAKMWQAPPKPKSGKLFSAGPVGFGPTRTQQVQRMVTQKPGAKA